MRLLDRIRVQIEMRRWDASFARFQRDNPGATFGHFYAATALAKINAGKPISSLGPLLRNAHDGAERTFETAGAQNFRNTVERFGIEPHHKLIDYGCGSFATGMHYIRFLDPGNYFGLDVTPSFIDIGKSLIGVDLLEEKRPHLAAIGEQSLSEAIEFAADFIVSNAVAYHVHPSELSGYCTNLVRLAAKPGCRVIFDVRLSDTEQRYRLAGWSWPLTRFVESLRPLTLVATHAPRIFTGAPVQRQPITAALLEFQNA
jgi:hypothetical protein